MTANSKIITRFKDLEYTMGPISTIKYYKYQQMVDEANEDAFEEKKARNWLVAACMISPLLTIEKVEKLPIGIFYALFNTLMNKSFLVPTV